MTPTPKKIRPSSRTARERKVTGMHGTAETSPYFGQGRKLCKHKPYNPHFGDDDYEAEDDEWFDEEDD